MALGKARHSLQQGIARARPCPRAQMGPWADVGHSSTHTCGQELPAQPCLPLCEHVLPAPVPMHVTRPLQGSKGPNGAWHRRFPARHWERWVLCW